MAADRETAPAGDLTITWAINGWVPLTRVQGSMFKVQGKLHHEVSYPLLHGWLLPTANCLLFLAFRVRGFNVQCSKFKASYIMKRVTRCFMAGYCHCQLPILFRFPGTWVQSSMFKASYIMKRAMLCFMTANCLLSSGNDRLNHMGRRYCPPTSKRAWVS